MGNCPRTPLIHSAQDLIKMRSDTIIILGMVFLKILNYVPKEIENFSAQT